MCLIRRVYGTELIKYLAHGCTYNVWTFWSPLKWAGTKSRIWLYCNSLYIKKRIHMILLQYSLIHCTVKTIETVII